METKHSYRDIITPPDVYTCNIPTYHARIGLESIESHESNNTAQLTPEVINWSRTGPRGESIPVLQPPPYEGRCTSHVYNMRTA